MSVTLRSHCWQWDDSPPLSLITTDQWLMSTLSAGYRSLSDSTKPALTHRVHKIHDRCLGTLAPPHQWGLWILPYLDDWLLCEQSQQQVMSRKHLLISYVKAPTLKVFNYEESHLTLAQTVLLTSFMQAFLTED